MHEHAEAGIPVKEFVIGGLVLLVMLGMMDPMALARAIATVCQMYSLMAISVWLYWKFRRAPEEDVQDEESWRFREVG